MVDPGRPAEPGPTPAARMTVPVHRHFRTVYPAEMPSLVIASLAGDA
jgi:hypothetical protein